MKAASGPFRSQLENSPSSWQRMDLCQSRWRRSPRWDESVFSQCSDVFFARQLIRFKVQAARKNDGYLAAAAHAGVKVKVQKRGARLAMAQEV